MPPGKLGLKLAVTLGLLASSPSSGTSHTLIPCMAMMHKASRSCLVWQTQTHTLHINPQSRNQYRVVSMCNLMAHQKQLTHTQMNSGRACGNCEIHDTNPSGKWNRVAKLIQSTSTGQKVENYRPWYAMFFLLLFISAWLTVLGDVDVNINLAEITPLLNKTENEKAH